MGDESAHTSPVTKCPGTAEAWLAFNKQNSYRGSSNSRRLLAWSRVWCIRIRSQDAPWLLLLIFTQPLLALSHSLSFFFDFRSALANAKCAIISITVINVCVVPALSRSHAGPFSLSLSLRLTTFWLGNLL